MPIVLTGRPAGTRRLFEGLVGLRNDVGLLAEEYDLGTRRLVGNFPQAFSHIALINTAHNVARTMKPCEQRSGSAWLPEPAEDTEMTSSTSSSSRTQPVGELVGKPPDTRAPGRAESRIRSGDGAFDRNNAKIRAIETIDKSA
jgi:hypothetical protein